MKVFIAGHGGMVGSALVRRYSVDTSNRLILKNYPDLDLCDQHQTEAFFKAEVPDLAIIAAAKVGGIHANNTYPAEFIQQNLAIASNCIHGAYKAGVKHLLFLGSSCIYPKLAPQPMREDCLLTGPLEPTNEAYALAKIAGLKLCQYYRKQYGVLYHSVMPTNLYGPGDNYHAKDSHVMPAMIRRFHEAKESGAGEVVLWGTGSPRREFLHVDDLADACFHLTRLSNPPDWVNIGVGQDVTIKGLAEMVAKVVGFQGTLAWDTTKPDGTPRKWLDVSLLSSLGWKAKLTLEEGIRKTYGDYLEEKKTGKVRE